MVVLWLARTLEVPNRRVGGRDVVPERMASRIAKILHVDDDPPNSSAHLQPV